MGPEKGPHLENYPYGLVSRQARFGDRDARYRLYGNHDINPDLNPKAPKPEALNPKPKALNPN